MGRQQAAAATAAAPAAAAAAAANAAATVASGPVHEVTEVSSRPLDKEGPQHAARDRSRGDSGLVPTLEQQVPHAKPLR